VEVLHYDGRSVLVTPIHPMWYALAALTADSDGPVACRSDAATSAQQVRGDAIEI
jgi:hypothetical protein